MLNIKKSPSRPKTNLKKILIQSLYVLLVLILTVAVATVGVGVGIVSAYTKTEKIRTKEDFDKELEALSQTSYAYFKEEDGKRQTIGAMINPDDRELVTDLKQVSPYLLDAFLSIEDKEFYDHNGIVPRSILRAAYQQVTGSEVTTGGSTLTQQLIKTHFLDYKDKSIKRKAVEIINSIRIEKYYEKPEIFIKYLNSVFFGEGAHGKNMYGVNAAARGLFNKKLNELELAQAAYIAGMVQRPNAYNPFRGEKELQYGLERMKLVLDKMLELEKITKEEYDKALKFDIKKSLAKPNMFVYGYDDYPFIITAVEREAVEILKELDQKNPKAQKKSGEHYTKMVRQGGLRIYTTIDKKMYDEVNKAANELHFPTRTYKGGIKIKEQIGATIVDNKTGGILAFYAGNFDENEEDHALKSKNQPGSSIKPLVVYGPAMNEGIISPNSIIIDEPIKKAGSRQVYKNADGNYRGPVTATDALKKSLNIPAVKILRNTGLEKSFEYLKKMKLPPHEKDGEALSLGGSTYGYTVANMTGAFAMIANYGKFNEAHVIDKIVTSDGKVIYDFKRDKGSKQIFKPQVSYQLIQMLRKVVTGGTATTIGARTYGYNVAGKTGTTTSQYDLWFVGFTPEISLGVWSGYDYNFVGSNNLAKDAWVKIFKAAADARPDFIKKGSEFKDPGGKLDTKCFECNKKSKYAPKKKKKEPSKRQNHEQQQDRQESNERNPDRDRDEEPQQPPGRNQGGNQGNHGHDGGGNRDGGSEGGRDQTGGHTGGQNGGGGNREGGNTNGGENIAGADGGGNHNNGANGSINPPPSPMTLRNHVVF